MDIKPYEKFMIQGPDSLSEAELLAIILRTGTKGEDTVSIAGKILDLSGGRNQGLLGLHHISVRELMTVKGIGQVKAVKIKCIAELSKRLARTSASLTVRFDNPSSIAGCYMEQLRHQETEHVYVLMLDSKNQLLHELLLSKGTVNASLLSVREVFLNALKYGAVSILILHNHPSGDPTPSRQDITITSKLKEAAGLIEIPLTDHIIIGDHSYTSFKQAGLL